MITSRLRTNSRAAAPALVGVLLAAPFLAACSVNFDAPTDKVYTPSRGVNDRSGAVDVLGVVVVSPSDGTGTVVATLVNNDKVNDDTLVDVAVDGQTAQFSPAAQNADIPAGGRINLADGAGVTGSGDGIAAGKFVDVTFAFESAQQITVHAPVVPNTGDYADIKPAAASTKAPK